MLPNRPSGTAFVLALAVLLAVPALAGCLGSTDAPADARPARGDGADEQPSRLRMAGCALQVGVFFPPTQVLDPAPGGFSHVSQDPAGATGTVIVAAETCRTVTADGAAVEDRVAEFHVYHVVDPPDAYEGDDDQAHALLVHAVTTSEDVANRYATWNLTSPEVGEVAMTAAVAADTVRVGTAEIHADDLSAELRTAAQTGEEAEERLSVRLYGIVDGEVTDVVDVTSTAYRTPTGTAELVLDPSRAEPTDVVPWAATQATTTGIGQHYVADDLTLDLVRRDPAAVRAG